MTARVIHPCKDNSVMVTGLTAKNLKMVDLGVEHAFLIFYLHLAELCNSPMGRYVSARQSLHCYDVIVCHIYRNFFLFQIVSHFVLSSLWSL